MPTKPLKLTIIIFFIIFFSVPTSTHASFVLTGNATLVSPNRTFELGFFTVDGGLNWFFGLWYASIPIRTYVWLANRLSPIPSSATPATASLTSHGHLALTDPFGSLLWSTQNPDPAADLRLLDSGNLLLLTSSGATAWQSFDFPSDTWLPNMTVTNLRPLLSWRSSSDPSPGLYSLRLRPPEYGEFELVFNASSRYWASGNWTGSRFAGVPEMTVPYIYSFSFLNPFTPEAAFVYSERPPPAGSGGDQLLTRFVVDSSGQLMQYTWSPQSASWNMFWSRPESPCLVYRRCGSLGLCSEGIRPCECLAGISPADPDAWASGDYSGGCARDSLSSCSDGDEFREVGRFESDGWISVSIPGVSKESCEDSCRANCSCFALKYDSDIKLCYNLYGSAYNLKNSSTSPIIHLRVSSSKSSERNRGKNIKVAVLIGCASGFLSILLFITITLMGLKWRRGRRNCCRDDRGGDDDSEGIHYPVTNLKVFTYKELSAATRGFSEKLGQGGFGAVFRGELPDSTQVAVKRLERPGGGGEREFRAEVRTIGNIQHVNLVRLRGFCCEDAHRLLVYDYMPNGPLSAYLTHHRNRNQSPETTTPASLSWQARFRIAVGTARGIAYLHEECRDCIIHCDIKPENILLDGEFTAKVSDFGLAKLMGRDLSRVLATMRGTWGYVAPEWISGVVITAKADVYSYGMMLLEILGGRRNVEAPAAEAEEGWFFPPWAARRIVEGDVAAVLDPGLGGEYDGREAERAALAAVWCIQDEEGERPAMGTVVKMLEGTVAVSVPPLPKLLQALVSGDSFPRAGVALSSSNNSDGEEISRCRRSNS